jgi:D-alanine-D-alanine ligase
MARVGLVFGGKSVEHLVSIVSARTVRDGLRAAGHEVIHFGIAEDGCLVDEEQGARVLDGGTKIGAAGAPIASSFTRLLETPLDVVFPIVHGTYGEDGTLQGMLAMLGIPCVGASVAASAIAMDKRLAKELFRSAGIPVVEGHVVSRADFERSPADALAPILGEAFPRFVKPSVGGSSVGCKRAATPAVLEETVRFALEFDDHVLVERAVKARELEVAVIGRGELSASLVGEIVPAGDFYDYEDKYVSDAAQLIAPARITESETARVQELAKSAFLAIGGDGMARVDFFLEADGTLSLNEINTLPGFTSISMYPRLWGLSGLPLPALVARLVDDALLAHRGRQRIDARVQRFVAEFAR